MEEKLLNRFLEWKFDYEVKKSITNEDSLILKIKNLNKK